MKILPPRLRKEDKFMAILREIAVGCIVDSSQTAQYRTRSVHEHVLIPGFNRSTKFLYQTERGGLFVSCRKVSEI
jgi:hypothetical protein